ISVGIFIYGNTHPHTDLSNEGLGSIKIDGKIDNNRIEPLESNVLYVTLKDQKDLRLVMEDDKVKELATSFDTTDESLQTQRNIGLGANFVDVVNQYGENFRKKAFVEEFDSGITYFDRKQKIKLSFYFNHDEKNQRLRYINLEQK
ncbi:TPA: hypothetical protein LP261_002954, partial [Enterococcus faecium]|nr:hypothetical protein [Enterococcus faecium]